MYSKDYSTLNNTGNATKTGPSSLGPNKCNGGASAAVSGSTTGNNSVSNAN